MVLMIQILESVLILSQVVKITLPMMKQHITAVVPYWMLLAGSITVHLFMELHIWNAAVGNKAQGHSMEFHFPGQHQYHCR